MISNEIKFIGGGELSFSMALDCHAPPMCRSVVFLSVFMQIERKVTRGDGGFHSLGERFFFWLQVSIRLLFFSFGLPQFDAFPAAQQVTSEKHFRDDAGTTKETR